MFCTKCGKELLKDDRFCAYCGAEARIGDRNTKKNGYEEIVFNPPFKIEAEKRTGEILKAASEESIPKAKKNEPIVFDWNLDGFPSREPKETEPINFNWDSVIERRNQFRENQEIIVEKIQPIEEKTKEAIPTPDYTQVDLENVTSIEELERELFGQVELAEEQSERETKQYIMPERKPAMETFVVAEPVEEPLPQETVPEIAEVKKGGDERFYTFFEKNEAFQQLLDKEKERIEVMEEEYRQSGPNMDYTWVGEVFPEKKPETVLDIIQPTNTMMVEVTVGEVEGTVVEPMVEVAADIAVERTATDLTFAEQIATDATAEETATDLTSAEQVVAEERTPLTVEETVLKDIGEQSPSSGKEKLRYSDIFPRVDLDDRSAGGNDNIASKSKEAIKDIYFEDDEEPPKKHIFLKIVITLLMLLILVEGIIIAVKFIAPDSALAHKSNEVIIRIMDLISGKTEKVNDDDDDKLNEEVDRNAYLDQIIMNTSSDSKTIGQIMRDPDLKYDSAMSYAFDEISSTKEFENSQWTKADGGETTYAKELIGEIVKHYDSWKKTNKDKDLAGINTLAIGEIRTETVEGADAKDFYTLCKIIYAGTDGNEVVKYQTVYASVSEDQIVINTIKEENL